jgi:hypothetical protein
MYTRIIDALNARFARRFTPDGEDYLYREKPDAAPLRVNARGHRLLIDGFYDRTGWLTTGLLFGFFYLVLALWWVAVASFYTFWERNIPWGLVTLMFSALLLAGWFDLWDFPQRAFFSGAVREKSIKDTWFRYVEYRTTWLWLIWSQYPRHLWKGELLRKDDLCQTLLQNRRALREYRLASCQPFSRMRQQPIRSTANKIILCGRRDLESSRCAANARPSSREYVHTEPLH